MSSLTLWGHAASVNVQKVLWALEELSLPYERRDVARDEGGRVDPEYRRLNPNALVPTLVDGNVAIWESNAIVRHLFRRYGQAPLEPDDLFQKAHADSWSDWQATTLWPRLRPLVVQLIRTPPARRDDVVIEAARRQAAEALGHLNGHLMDQAFVAGPHFTWGDIAVGVSVRRWYALPLARPELSALGRWYERVCARPGFVKWVAGPVS